MATKQAVTAEPDTGIRVLVFKADSTIIANASPVEDDTYAKWYRDDTANGLIAPPYEPHVLEELVERNNTLTPCISAMITNVDGTGYELERRDGEKSEDKDEKATEPATQFFDECYPMISFMTLRQRMRRELESTGNGYMEVIRNASDEIVFVGPLESKMMRIARLDKPVPVKIEIERKGKLETITQLKRERRFAQKVGEQLMWFKEFGASRDLDKTTGAWAEQGKRLPYDRRASEVLHFGVIPDINTPYYVPRWIGQIPSVLGGRKAEEHNLEYFESGGIPPYLIIVEGGQMAENTVDALRAALNQKGSHSRAQVIEAFATGGMIDKGSSVKVKVERFGGERTNDAMFQEYDGNCEDRIRKSFRLPEILIGKTESMNFATAHASYLVAEAQVFKPERDAFDEVISNTLLPNILGSRDYVYRSKPISIVDADTQLAVIGKALGIDIVDRENIVTLLGEIGGMEFKTVDLSKIKDAPTDQFHRDPTGNVVPININDPNSTQSQFGKSEDEVGELRYDLKSGLSQVLGCTLAMMERQGG